MAWVEISREVSEDGETITTLVQYDFLNQPILVSHFVLNINPSNVEQYIQLGLGNREITEKIKVGLLPPPPIPEIIIPPIQEITDLSAEEPIIE